MRRGGAGDHGAPRPPPAKKPKSDGGPFHHARPAIDAAVPANARFGAESWFPPVNTRSAHDSSGVTDCSCRPGPEEVRRCGPRDLCPPMLAHLTVSLSLH